MEDFQKTMVEKDSKVAALQKQLNAKKTTPKSSSLLSPQQKEKLITINVTFYETFDCDEMVVAEMLGSRLINEHKREELLKTHTSHKKNEIVYSWLLKASLQQAIEFRNILKRRGQDHVADLLAMLDE